MEKSSVSSDIVSWLTKNESWSSRKTGSPDHLECIEWIAQEFTKLNLTVYRDTNLFSHYNLPETKVTLTVADGDTNKNIVISSVYPFSGFTGSNGISSQLVYIKDKRYGQSKGKIAVVEVPNKAVPSDALFDILREFPDNEKIIPDKIYNPVLSATLFGPDLVAYRKAGALGVIAVWKNMSPGLASGQYLPFTFPYRDIPAIWVAGDDGRYVLDKSRNGTDAKLTLDGTLDTAVAASTVWTMIEGKNTNETILIISHSDGTNPVEENGMVGVLSIAKEIVARGEKPPRTLVFAAVAGHLRLPDITKKNKEQATTVWLNEHPELWNGKDGNKKAVAGLVIEHLGAMEWTDTDSGYRSSGKPEIEVVYATTSQMQEIVYKNWTKRKVPYRSSVVTPRSIRHLGEGEPLFEKGIPAVALLGIPSYLLSEMKTTGPGITKNMQPFVNADLASDQCIAALNVLDDMSLLPSAQFGRVKHVGFFGKIKDVFKVIKVFKSKT